MSEYQGKSAIPKTYGKRGINNQQEANSKYFSKSTSSNTLSVIQRIGSNNMKSLNFHGPEEDTIKGLIDNEPAFQLPKNFHDNIPAKKISRAESAEAVIPKYPTGFDKNGRGKAIAPYKAIGYMGNWERMALTHGIEAKTIDVGHLIADQFFNKSQKDKAYDGRNLAPQNSVFNEKAYQDLVEKPIAKSLASSDVRLKLTLGYPADKKISFETLFNRNAIEITDQKKALKKIRNDETLEFPARYPNSWDPDIKKEPRNKSDKAKIERPAKEVFEKYSHYMTDDTEFTKTRRFGFTAKLPKKQKHNNYSLKFRQDHVGSNEDGKSNFLKESFNSENVRATPFELECAEKGYENGKYMSFKKSMKKTIKNMNKKTNSLNKNWGKRDLEAAFDDFEDELYQAKTKLDDNEDLYKALDESLEKVFKRKKVKVSEKKVKDYALKTIEQFKDLYEDFYNVTSPFDPNIASPL